VARLAEALSVNGMRVWLDVERIPPTTVWLEELRSGIEAADAFVFVLSPASVASEVCGIELSHAGACNKRIVPVLHRDVSGHTVAPELRERQWIDFSGEADFDERVHVLTEALLTDIDALRYHTRLLVRALDWNARGRTRDNLLRGRELTEAQAFTSRDEEPQPVPAQLAYVQASAEAAVRRRRRIRIGAAAVAAAAVTLLVFGLLQASRARHERQTARSRDLAARSMAVNAGNGVTALELAVSAMAASPTDQARTALARATTVSRLTAVLRGHTDSLTDAAFSPDGSRVATASSDGTVRVWDWRTSESPVILRGHDGTVWSVDFDPASGRYAAAGYEGSVRVWDVRSAREVKRLRTHGLVADAEFSPDGRTIAIADGAEIRIVDWRTTALRRRFAASSEGIQDVDFSPDGAWIAAACNDGSVRVWHVRGGARTVALKGAFDGRAAHVQFDDRSRLILASGEYGRILLWDPVTGQKAKVTDAAASGPFGPDFGASFRQLLLAAPRDADRSLGLWSLESARPAAVLRGHASLLSEVAFSRDGRYVVTAGADGIAAVWDVGLRRRLDGGSEGTDAVAFTRDGRHVVLADGRGVVYRWDAEAGGNGRRLAAMPQTVHAVGFRRNGDLVSVLDRGGVVVTKPSGRSETMALERVVGLPIPIQHAAVSPDGQRVATVDLNDTIKVWDISGPAARELLSDDFLSGDGVAFAPDGNRVAGAGGTGSALPLWSVRAGGHRQLMRLRVPAPKALVFLGGDRYVGGGGLDAVGRVWDVQSGTVIAELPNAGEVQAIAATADGRLVALADGEGNVRVWDWRARSVLATIRATSAKITQLAFDPTGLRLVVGDATGVGHIVGCEACAPTARLLQAARAKLRLLQTQAQPP
jgi:WD40 repeat protein